MGEVPLYTKPHARGDAQTRRREGKAPRSCQEKVSYKCTGRRWKGGGVLIDHVVKGAGGVGAAEAAVCFLMSETPLYSTGVSRS